MIHTNILTINQIIDSENTYIKKNSFDKLINHAASKISSYIFKNFKKQKVLLICGPGNNGMDGILSFNKLKEKMKVSLIKVNKDNFDIKLIKNLIESNQIIFDCILGTGLNRKISGNFKKVIQEINKSNKTVISIDIPSGINGDSGEIMGMSVKANITLAMGFIKPGYYLFPGKENIGKIEVIKLNLQIPSYRTPKITLIKQCFFNNKFPNYGQNINKYNKGHVLVIGGTMAGASRLVAYSARKTGCGLTTICVEKRNLSFYSQTEPGTIIKVFQKKDLDKKDVLVIGPGLGKGFNKNKILSIINSFNGPIIIDADAISIFENHKKDLITVIRKKRQIILTPHLGEFKRLFRFNFSSKILNCYSASKLIENCVLLKGNDSVISFPEGRVWLNNGAKNNLATAGSGDLLCGIIAGLLSQKMPTNLAVPCSILIQNKISSSQNDVVVEDFLNNIPAAIKSLKNNN